MRLPVIQTIMDIIIVTLAAACFFTKKPLVNSPINTVRTAALIIAVPSI